jgi:hypothetical protein
MTLSEMAEVSFCTVCLDDKGKIELSYETMAYAHDLHHLTREDWIPRKVAFHERLVHSLGHDLQLDHFLLFNAFF